MRNTRPIVTLFSPLLLTDFECFGFTIRSKLNGNLQLTPLIWSFRLPFLFFFWLGLSC
jgi:hypothetical protein